MYITHEDFAIDPEHQSRKIPNTDDVRQSTLMQPGITLEYVFEDAKTAVEAIQRGCRVSNDGQCLGWRDSDPEYKWLSYSETIQRSKHISFGLVHAGMQRGQESFIGIYSQNCVEWVLVEHACYLQSAVVVPLYDTLGPTACTFILNRVEAEILVCDSAEKATRILNAKEDIPKLRHIIIMHEITDEVKKLAEKNDVHLYLLKDIEESGRKNPDKLILPRPSDLATLCFTSGTTGDPKGVMLTHGNMVANASAFIKHLGIGFINAGDKTISYLPMGHMFDRMNQVVLYLNGGAVGFFRGDIKLLLEDLNSLAPTMVPAVPRVLNKVFDRVQCELKASPIKKILLDAALRAKQADLQRGIIRNTSMWDRLILKNIRNIFGGKVKLLVSGGAPIRSEVLSFFRCSLGCVVVEAYGQTECTCVIASNVMGDRVPGTVGPPVPGCFIKLQEVPEMGYYKHRGEGEILVKGPIVMKGYFKDPTRTAETIDENGWLHTGDIGRWNKNGALSVIDRKKSLLKLSQGEYISPEKVEGVYQTCPYVEQIVVLGDSLESCLVAIVVPEKETVISWCSMQGIKGQWNEICENKVVKDHILKDLYDIGKKAGLKGFEQVKAIHLHPDLFTQQNGILTVTMKTKRGECQKQFKEVIQKMYNSIS